MYLSALLVQIASSIIGLRYENVDPCFGAQSHCYERNLEASWGRPSSKVEVGGEEGGVAREKVTRRRNALLCIFSFFITAFLKEKIDFCQH